MTSLSIWWEYKLEEALGTWLVECGVTAEGRALAVMVTEAAVDSGLHHSLALGP